MNQYVLLGLASAASLAAVVFAVLFWLKHREIAKHPGTRYAKTEKDLADLKVRVASEKKRIEKDLVKTRQEKELRIKKIETEHEKNLAKMETKLDSEIAKVRAKEAEVQAEWDAFIQEKEELTRRANEEMSAIQDEYNIQSHGLYEPKYDFETSEQYKAKMASVRDRQKEMIRHKTAITGSTTWTVNGSEAQGRKMVDEHVKLMARAFNGECDSIIGTVRYSNLASVQKRIETSFRVLNRLGKSKSVEITEEYLDLKIQELYLLHEYRDKLNDEKEERARIAALIREEERAQREMLKAQQDAEKEEAKYEKALEQARKEMEAVLADQEIGAQESVDSLNDEIARLEGLLQQAHEDKERAKSMAQLTKAGYIYVISNIGSFGEDVYKIGMTRRLNPEDRIKELGDASVPFKFDKHALIYTTDAPTLEKKIHQKFERRRVNLANYRKEFFFVTLPEIKQACGEIGLEAEFVDMPTAEEFRRSEALREDHQKKGQTQFLPDSSKTESGYENLHDRGSSRA